MNDINWQQLGTGFAVAFIAFMQVYQAWRSKRQDAKLEVVHTLVNSGMSEQLRIGMVSARTLANLTNAAADIEMAETAEKKYRTHEEKQLKADSL